MRKRLVTSAFFGAVVGGAIVAGVMFAAAGPGTKVVRTTIVEQAPLTRDDGTSSEHVRDAPTLAEIYARDAPGVVHITATVVRHARSQFALMPAARRDTQTGSGFVVGRNGAILTNAHLIDGAVKIAVAFEEGRTETAAVIGKDSGDDVALLQVDPRGLRLVPLPLGDSSTVRVGDPTAAIADPFGFARTLSTGIVSALWRSTNAPRGLAAGDVIQTDAPVNPGNSGGPLLNAQGEVIGVNSQIYPGGGSAGIAFAIPINRALAAIPRLRRAGGDRSWAPGTSAGGGG
jgi:putative serine protease PepD